MAPFSNEEQRRDYYESLNQEVPPFSTLNSDVVPTPEFLESVEKHQAKFDTELIADIWKECGV